MKRCITALLLMMFAVSAKAASPSLTSLALRGEIDGENIVFTMDVVAANVEAGSTLDLVNGDVAWLDGSFPSGSKLVRTANGYRVVFSDPGWGKREQRVQFKFASRPTRAGEWRHTRFDIPIATVRKLSVVCDRNDLDVRFPGALNAERAVNEDERTEVTAFLGLSRTFEVRWKPEVRKLDADLAMTCDANTVATADIGALRLDSVFTFRVIQGRLNELRLDLPDVNVTQVRGENIQGWTIEPGTNGPSCLVVSLSRPHEQGAYPLHVETEMVLPDLPCNFDMPVLVPRRAIRTSGFVLVGANSAIKLSVDKAAGLTQVDQNAFPAVTGAAKPIQRPTRSVYAYQYANATYTLGITADDIVTAMAADCLLALVLGDDELVMTASVELDIKDAPLREVQFATDAGPEWTVTSVSGQHVSEPDTDVRKNPEDPKERIIHVPFKQAVLGTTLVHVRLERTLARDASGFTPPTFAVRDARSQRGYLVLGAEKGVQLKASTFDGLREVHTGSAPMQVTGAQQAFRFKAAGWSLDMDLERARPSIHSELFHLVSLGEGVMYCSAAISYHIGGAPLQELELEIPADIKSFEITGADIESWSRDGERCLVRLQSKIIGDYTLLVTYDSQYAPEGATIQAGGIRTLGTESDVGYIAAASSASLRIEQTADLPESIIDIEPEELPRAYATPIADPVIASYKYVRAPHRLAMRVVPFETQPLLGQNADYVRLSTKLSEDGESVTRARYFVKNATRQYLVCTLPENAELWSVRYIEADGTSSDAMSQHHNGRYLVPLKRPRDPNEALQVEIVYAESLGELGFWHSALQGIRLQAPHLPETHTTFATWELTVPEGYAIAGAGGDLIADDRASEAGLMRLGKGTLGVIRAVLDGPGKRTLESCRQTSKESGRTRSFTRTVSLAAETPVELRASIVPVWVGPSGSVPLFLGALLAWLAALSVRMSSQKWRRLSGAVMWTCLLVALAATQLTRELGAATIALALMLPVGWKLLRVLLRAGRASGRGCGRFGRHCAERRRTRKQAREQARERARRIEAATPTAEATEEADQKSGGREGNDTGQDDTPDAASDDDPLRPFDPPPANSGFAGIGPLLLIALVSLLLALLPALARGESEHEAAAIPIMEKVDLTIEAPGTDEDAEQSARIVAKLKFTTARPVQLPLVPAHGVLLDFTLPGRDMKLHCTTEGYLLNVSRKGTYEVTASYRVPVEQSDGTWHLTLPVLPNMRNRIELKVPEPGFGISSPEAVLFRATEDASSSSAEAVLGPSPVVNITWKPKLRKTRLEDAVFFCEVNSYAALRPGVVEVTSLVRYQPARGEIKELKLGIPADMNVTAVQAPGLATWRFNPDTRELDAILERPVHQDVLLRVVTQMPCNGLPYAADIGAIVVHGATRQRGALSVNAPDSVQVQFTEAVGVSPMNIGDFPTAALQAPHAGSRQPISIVPRRAFRYHDPSKVRVPIRTEKVLPELRLRERSALSIGDERIVLSSQLELAVAKSGIFSAALLLPEGFEVESLTGPEVSHWDETRGTNRQVVIHFSRQVKTQTQVNLVLARMERGIEDSLVVPRVQLAESRKHTGRLTISSERGVRLIIDEHHGVDVRKASEEGIHQSGVLVFNLLRPNWSIKLRTDVLAPQVKPEVLQRVDLSEGMLLCTAYLRYRIENAGVKSFRLRSPHPNAALSVVGRDIARVRAVDRTNGVWQVDLHSKRQHEYKMTVTCQVPYDPAEQRVDVVPLRTLDTEDQRGYLAVFCSGRVQLSPLTVGSGLKVEDARSVPAEFAAGDLSDAVQCYRMLKPDPVLTLSVVRHDAADVLPASIERANLLSVVSSSHKLLTRVQLSMVVGNHRFLRVTLPNEDDKLWTSQVNGSEVAVAVENGAYLLPLAEQSGEGATDVEIIYASAATRGALSRRQRFRAPKFGLPLNNIQWQFYVRPNRVYRGFDGNMQVVAEDQALVTTFDATHYQARNKEQRDGYIEKAKRILDAGAALVQSGDQERARKAFEQALNYSQAEADLNEDARVQLRNLQKQQVKFGLLNRRDNIRYKNNAASEEQIAQMEAYNDGNFTQADLSNASQQLSEKERDALDIVADKIIDQQAAAAAVVTAIRATVPEHGRLIQFERPLLNDRNAELWVEFEAGSEHLDGVLRQSLPAVLLLLVLCCRPMRRKKDQE